MASLDEFFCPTSVVIIGASRKPGKIGHEILRVLKDNRDRGSFGGELHVINPHADEILGIRSYRSVPELPEPPDLAVVAIPANATPQIVEDLGKKGTKSVVIISGGFAEVGGQGAGLQEEVMVKARKYGVRIVGPNCIGVVSPETGIDTMFLPYAKEIDGLSLPSLPRPVPGSISLITQSGAFGVACIDYMAGEGLGLAKFVSYGNKADVDEAELIEYLGRDPKTKVIVIYAESIDRGRRFMEAARKAAKKKPIVAMKAGRTRAGARAALSHTAAFVGSDEVYEAAFKQCGIMRVRSVEEMFDVAKALSMQPPAKGRRVAVLTDGGGAGVMAVDELESRGQIMANLSGEVKERLSQLMRRRVLVPIAALENPVDVTGSADDRAYVRVFEVLMEGTGVDGVVVIALHYIPGMTGRLPEELARIARSFEKPVVCCDIGKGEYGVAFREKFEKYGFPAYPTPERAAVAMSALTEYGQIRRKLGTG